MLGKTHLAVGTATTLLILQPHSMKELILGVTIGGLGALIPDIDVNSSTSHKEANRIVAYSFIMFFLCVIADWIFKAGIYTSLKRNHNAFLIVIGLILFIGICAFGKETPHRSFMHSLLCLVLLSCCLSLIYAKMVPYFVVGFLSHIIVDLFNFKRVMLLYPYKKGVAFKLFHANGYFNRIFFTAGSIASISLIAIWGYEIIH